jgi:hypothetical protein
MGGIIGNSGKSGKNNRKSWFSMVDTVDLERRGSGDVRCAKNTITL